jgi:hypothetical protein
METSVTVTCHLERHDAFRQALHQGLAGAGVGPVDAMFKRWAFAYSSFVQRRFDALSAGGSFGGDTWLPLANSTIQARAHRLLKVAAFRKMLAHADTKLLVHTRKEREAVYMQELKSGVDKWQAGQTATSMALKFFRAHGGRIVTSQRRGTILTNPRRFETFGNRKGTKAQLARLTDMRILLDTGIMRGALNIGTEGNVNERRGAVQTYGLGAAPHAGSNSTIGKIAAYHQAGGVIPGRPPQRKILVAPDEPTKAIMGAQAAIMLRTLAGAMA